MKLLNLVVKFEEEKPTDDEDTTDESQDFSCEFDYVIAAESSRVPVVGSRVTRLEEV